MSDSRVRFAFLLIAAAMLVFSALDQLAFAIAFYGRSQYPEALGAAAAVFGRVYVAWALIDIARDQ